MYISLSCAASQLNDMPLSIADNFAVTCVKMAYMLFDESVVCEWMKNNQKDLENVTEQLSEYLERDITSDTLGDIKQKVQDKSR